MSVRRSLALALVSALFASCSAVPTRPDYWALEGAQVNPGKSGLLRVVPWDPPASALETEKSRAAYALTLLSDPQVYVQDARFFAHLRRVIGKLELSQNELRVMSEELLVAKLLYLRLLERQGEAEKLHAAYRRAHPAYSWQYATPEPAPMPAQPEIHPSLVKALESSALWNLGEAAAWLRKAAGEGANHADRLWVGAEIAFKGGDPSAAEEQLGLAASAGSRRAEVFTLMGRVAASRGHFALAEFHFATALRFHPFHEGALLGIAEAKHRLLGHEATRAYLERGLGRQPENYALWLAIGEERRRALDFRAAREAFALAFKFNSKAYLGYLLTGDLARQEANALLEDDLARERNGFAVSMFELHGKLFPASADAPFRLAELYFDVRELEQAASYFRKTIALAPNYPKAHLRLAQIERHFGRSEAAKELLQQEIARNPISDAPWVEKGNIAMAEKDFNEASKCFNAAYRLNPRNSDALFGEGVVKHLMGDYEAALALFRHALMEDPLKHDIHWQMGLVYQKVGRHLEAAHAFSTYKQLTREPASLRRAEEKLLQLSEH